MSPTPQIDIGALMRSFVARRIPDSEVWREQFGRGLTLDRINSAILSAADGYMRDIADLATETIALDPHLGSVLRKRFGKLAGCDWDITPAQDDGIDKAKAACVAGFVRQQLKEVPDFPQVIEDISWGHFDGRAANELHWDRRLYGPVSWQLAEMAWLHPRRLSFGPERELRIVDAWAYNGNFRAIGLDTRCFAKFATFKPRLFREYPEREGLAPRVLYWSFFKRFTARERQVLLELYGKPWKIVEDDTKQYVTPASDALDEALDQADALNGATAVKLPRGTRLRVEAPDPKAGELHLKTIDDCDRQISKLVLGATSTTDAQASGIGSDQSRVHQDETQDIINADGVRVSAVIQRDVVRAIVVLNAAVLGLSAHETLRYCPSFQVRTAPEKNRKAELDRAKAFIDLGLAVAVDELREMSGFRKPLPGEAIVQIVEAPQDDQSARYIPPRAKVYDPSGSEPGIGEWGGEGAKVPPAGGAAPPAPPAPPGAPALPPAPPGATTSPSAADAQPLDDGASAPAAPRLSDPDEDFEIFHGPLGPVAAELADLAAGQSDGERSNFPAAGDNLRPSLRNSRYLVFPASEAQALKTEWPEIWKRGGNVLGNLQFRRLAPIAARGGRVETDTEEEAVRLREAWAARHHEDQDLASVVAQVKWLVIGAQGLERMRRVLAQEKARLRERQASAAPPSVTASRRSTRRTFCGIDIVIDRPRGFVQEGVDSDGVAWSRAYLYDYGYIPRTRGGDGDGLDVFVGNDDTATAFWILQNDGFGAFDEYKIMLGFPGRAEAVAAYLAHVPERHLGEVRETSVEMIKALLGLEPEERIKQLSALFAREDHVLCAAHPATVHGSPETIVANGVHDGASVTAAWAKALAEAVDGLTTRAKIRIALSKAAAALPVEDLAALLESTMVHSAMLGTLDADWEAENDGIVAPATFAGGQQGFAAKPFAEALRWFEKKEVVPKTLFDRLFGAAKKAAFTVAKLARTEMIQTAKDELAKVIAAGTDLRSFRKALSVRFDSAGWTKLNDSHVEVIFRNAVMGSYSAGRDVQMRQPHVLAARPYWQIRVVRDDRTRDTHAAVRNKVLRADDPFWRTVGRPPFGHMCRCVIISRSERDLKRLNLTVVDGSSISGLPDPGWSGSISALV